MARRPKLSLVSFAKHEVMARALARELGASYVSLTSHVYPAGERYIRVSRKVLKRCVLVADLEAEASSLWDILLARDALLRSGAKRLIWIAPWMAYGRQDRPAQPRESVGGLVLGDVLRRSFRRIITLDAHSRRFIRSSHGALRSILPRDLMAAVALRRGATAIAAPDAGALRRAWQVARRLRLPLITCAKVRLGSGPGSVRVRITSGNPRDLRVMLVDDLLDSGGTLAAAAKALRDAGARAVLACVTHLAAPERRPEARALLLGHLDILYPRGRAKVAVELVRLLAHNLRR